MGLVLAFDAAPRHTSRPAVRRAGSPQPAEILFFTGVRYDRRDASRASSGARNVQPAEQSTPAS